MKKSALLVLVSAAFVLTGCGLSLPLGGADSSAKLAGIDTLHLEKGKVVLEEYSTEVGSAEEVEAFLKNEIDPSMGVTLDKCTEKDGKVYVKTTYDGMGEYSEFTGYGLGYGTVLEGRLAGHKFDETVYSVDGGVVTANTYSINDQDKFAAVYQTVTVEVSGEIIAISDVAAVCGKNTAYVHANEDGSPVIIIYK